MELKDVLQMGVERTMAAAQLSDLKIGTVTSVSPLAISINTSMAPLTSAVLYLTSAVVEKKIPVLKHGHTTSGLSHSHTVSELGHSHTVGGETTSTTLSGSYATSEALSADAYASSEALADIACVENGVALPVEGGYIILNRGLAVGDKVLLLRVQRGEKFVVLSRVMEA